MSDHKKRKHALCGASSASRWMKCPGSIYLGWGIRSPMKPWTMEGTVAHELAERILSDWMANKCEPLSPGYIRDRMEEYKDTEEPETYPWSDGKRRVNMVDYCLEYIDVVKGELLGFHGPYNTRIEQNLDLDAALHMFGTLDFFATGHDINGVPFGTIVDFKYGRGVAVTAGEENWQLAYYACMLLRNSKLPLELIRTVICQPRAAQKVSVCQFTAAELDLKRLALTKGATEAIYQAAGREPDLHAGEHCRFCPAKNTCPQYVELPPPSLSQRSETAAASETDLPADCETPSFTDLE